MSKTKRKKLDSTKLGASTAELKKSLEDRVIGQPEAIEALTEAYQEYSLGLSDKTRPVANLLLAGPTGTGKTHVCEVFSEVLAKDRRALIKVDCGEFQHSHEVGKLIGSPPGYLGHRETQPVFTQEKLIQHHTEKNKLSFVLFDEIEKASDALRKILLGVLDKATLTLGDNRRVDFSGTMIFMTSNLGAAEFDKVNGGNIPGFHQRNQSDGKYKENFNAAIRKKFDPEFLNRIDRTVVFNPLGPGELQSIIDLEFGLIQRRLIDVSVVPILLSLSPRLRGFLLEKGADKRYGARNIKRVLRHDIMQPVARLLASGQLMAGEKVEADLEGDKVEFYVIGSVATVGDVRVGLAGEAA